MKWWGDLWLNESFATLVSYYACEYFIDEVKESPLNLSEIDKSQIWLHFNKEVTKALIDDSLPTTHPIEAQCNTSD